MIPETLIREVNKMLRDGREETLRFCFELFDLNQDGKICIQDAYDLMDLLYEKDHVLQKDVLTVINVSTSEANL